MEGCNRWQAGTITGYARQQLGLKWLNYRVCMCQHVPRDPGRGAGGRTGVPFFQEWSSSSSCPTSSSFEGDMRLLGGQLEGCRHALWSGARQQPHVGQIWDTLSLCPGSLHVCVCVSAFPSEGTDWHRSGCSSCLLSVIAPECSEVPGSGHDVTQLLGVHVGHFLLCEYLLFLPFFSFPSVSSPPILPPLQKPNQNKKTNKKNHWPSLAQSCWAWWGMCLCLSSCACSVLYLLRFSDPPPLCGCTVQCCITTFVPWASVDQALTKQGWRRSLVKRKTPAYWDR